MVELFSCFDWVNAKVRTIVYCCDYNWLVGNCEYSWASHSVNQIVKNDVWETYHLCKSLFNQRYMSSEVRKLKVGNQVELWVECPFELRAYAKYLVEACNREQEKSEGVILLSEEGTSTSIYRISKEVMWIDLDTIVAILYMGVNPCTKSIPLQQLSWFCGTFSSSSSTIICVNVGHVPCWNLTWLIASNNIDIRNYMHEDNLGVEVGND